MNDTDKKIAEWLGLNPIKRVLGDGSVVYTEGDSNMIIRDYLNSDAHAITLLPVLVERGYYPVLGWAGSKRGPSLGLPSGWIFTINDKYDAIRPTISAAITAAVIELIDKENV